MTSGTTAPGLSTILAIGQKEAKGGLIRQSIEKNTFTGTYCPFSLWHICIIGQYSSSYHSARANSPLEGNKRGA